MPVESVGPGLCAEATTEPGPRLPNGPGPARSNIPNPGRVLSQVRLRGLRVKVYPTGAPTATRLSVAEVRDGVDHQIERGLGLDLPEHIAVGFEHFFQIALIDQRHAACVRSVQLHHHVRGPTHEQLGM